MPDIKRLADGIYLQVFYVFWGKNRKNICTFAFANFET